MKKMSKIVAITVAIAAAVCMGVLSGCGGNYSETYTGALSAQSYTSEENAAKAFLSEEVSSSSSGFTFSKVDVDEEALPEEEVEKLVIEDSASVEYVKKATVYYTESSTQPLAAAFAGSNAELSQMLYIVKYVDGGFKYYSPALSNGESLTKSYFDDVMSTSRYESVSVYGNMTTTVRATVSYMGRNETSTERVQISYNYKIGKNAVTLEITQRALGETAKMNQYLVKTDKGFVAVIEIPGLSTVEYEVSSMSGLDVAADFLWSGLLQSADHTYFQKTNTGFSMKTEQAKEMVGGLFEEAGIDTSLIDMFDEIEYNFYVTEGNVSRFQEKASASFDMTESGMDIRMAVAASSDYNFSGFGTTTVTLPDSVVAELISRGYTVITD